MCPFYQPYIARFWYRRENFTVKHVWVKIGSLNDNLDWIAMLTYVI